MACVPGCGPASACSSWWRRTRALEKVVRLAEGRGVPSVVGPPSADIGQRLGRPPVMVVGVRDPDLARGIRAAGNKAAVGTED
jgi:hypothetical protein